MMNDVCNVGDNVKKNEKIKVVIINRYFPPEPNMTGVCGMELAQYLSKNSINVSLVTIPSVSSKGSPKVPKHGYLTDQYDDAINIVPVSTLYNGKIGILRVLGFFFEGLLLIKKSISLKADVYIIMTTPALLNMWASILYSNKNRWFLWSMDLYPEAYGSDGKISKSNLAYKLIDYLTYKNAPDHIIALGPSQQKYLSSKYSIDDLRHSILPAGIYDSTIGVKENVEINKIKRARVAFGYFGNLGPQHSAELLLSIAKYIDASKAILIVSIYGPKSAETLKKLKQYDCVVQKEYLSQTELENIDIHVSSLRPTWTHVCVPSKTVSAVCSGNAFLFCGSDEADNWGMFENAGWRIDPNNIEIEIADFFGNFSLEELKKKSNFARSYGKQMLFEKHKSFDNILSDIMDFTDTDKNKIK